MTHQLADCKMQILDLDEIIIHKEVQIEDLREDCIVLCSREAKLTKQLEDKEDELRKQKLDSTLEDEQLQVELTLLEEELKKIEYLEIRMRTAVLDGKKVEVLPTDDDILLFELSEQLAVVNGNGTSWNHHQDFNPFNFLQHHNELVDLFDNSNQYDQFREEIKEKHHQLAAKIKKKNAALTALQNLYNSKFKGKLFFLRRKKEIKKKLKDTLVGLRQEVTILEIELKNSEKKYSTNKTFDINLEF